MERAFAGSIFFAAKRAPVTSFAMLRFHVVLARVLYIMCGAIDVLS